MVPGWLQGHPRCHVALVEKPIQDQSMQLSHVSTVHHLSEVYFTQDVKMHCNGMTSGESQRAEVDFHCFFTPSRSALMSEFAMVNRITRISSLTKLCQQRCQDFPHHHCSTALMHHLSDIGDARDFCSSISPSLAQLAFCEHSLESIV